MRQRGRKSSSFVALRVDGSPPPLQPPAYLNEEERALFAELIAAVDTRAFVPSDTPLLVSFVQATLVSHEGVQRLREEERSRLAQGILKG